MTPDTLIAGIDDQVDTEATMPEAPEVDSSVIEEPSQETSAQIGQTMGWVSDYAQYDREHGITTEERQQLDAERDAILKKVPHTD